VGQNGSKIEKKSFHGIPDEIPHILMVSLIVFIFGDFSPQIPQKRLSPQTPPLQDNLGETRKTASLARSHLAGTQKPVSQVPSTQKSD